MGGGDTLGKGSELYLQYLAGDEAALGELIRLYKDGLIFLPGQLSSRYPYGRGSDGRNLYKDCHSQAQVCSPGTISGVAL